MSPSIDVIHDGASIAIVHAAHYNDHRNSEFLTWIRNLLRAVSQRELPYVHASFCLN